MWVKSGLYNLKKNITKYKLSCKGRGKTINVGKNKAKNHIAGFKDMCK